MNKNFENLKNFLNGHTNSFKIIVLTDTWLKNENANENSFNKVLNYTPILVIKKTRVRVVVLPCLFIIFSVTRTGTILAGAMISLKLFPLKLQ